MSRESNAPNKPIRWWPAAIIVGAMVVLLAKVWLSEAPSHQTQVVSTFPIVGLGIILLTLWAVLFSRLARPVRLKIFAAIVLVAVLFGLLFEIRGVSGNIVPILGFRWSGEPVFASDSRDAGVTAPGPNDFPQFYGPGRDAMLAGPALARDWEAQPPRELWRRDVGEGWSSFAIVGSAALTMELRGDLEAVVRYDLATGEQVWVHSDPAPFNTTVGGSGPRATPTVADGRVYTFGATGLLSCLELRDGSVVWQRNVLEEHDKSIPEWGLASSPLIVDDLVVVQLGDRSNLLVAHHRDSGEPVWQADIARGSYNSPILAELQDVPQIISSNGGSVTGHDPTSGATLWTVEWRHPSERVAPPLVMGENRLLVSAGYGAGSLMIEVTETEGVLSASTLWDSPRLKSKFAPVVRLEGTVYGLDDGILVALDPETGERHWKGGRYGHGQLLLVGDLLLIVTEKGDVVMVEANPTELRELGRFPAFDGKTWNPPALSGRLLLVRNNREAAAYELPLAP
jgi:outer membrane protein assembly factor BamB